VRDGRIRVVQGTIDRVEGRTVNASGVGGSMETLEADNVLLATGYKLVGDPPPLQTKLPSPIIALTFSIGSPFLQP
jgi:pyruvate/2-oxoglutarate dehydrogenase complex dihydrolipoamide dehydrogenase (E3) component